MKQLKEMAEANFGLEMRVIRREPGGGIAAPAVVHLKCNHFAAVMKVSGEGVHIKDPTFGNDTWMTLNALDDESSGYFLVPAGMELTGSAEVTDAEAAAVMGRGHSGGSDLGATGGKAQQTCASCTEQVGMAAYSFHLMRASLIVGDTPLRIKTPYGGDLDPAIAYHQREAGRPDVPTFTHFGQQWVCNWVSWLDENTANCNADVTVYYPGGGFETFTGITGGVSTRSHLSGNRLHRIGSGHFEVRFQDGSSHTYNITTGTGIRKVFLTQMKDTWGNVTSLTYNVDIQYPFRIRSVSRSGISLYFFYQTPGDVFAVSHVADTPSLNDAYKKAVFGYTTVAGGLSRLTSITDVVGITSSFEYDSTGFMTSLTTPYGTTTFATGADGASRWVSATDPNGDTEKVLYTILNTHALPMPAPNRVPVAPGDDPNERLIEWDDRNCYHWSKIMWKAGPDDVTKAHAYHWVQTPSGADSAISVLEWEKPPLQDFIWYKYPGQSGSRNGGTAATPSMTATMIEDEDGSLIPIPLIADRMFNASSGKLERISKPSSPDIRYTYGTVTGVDTVNPGTDLTKVEILDPTVGAAPGTWRTLLNVTAYENHQPKIWTDEQGITTTVTFNAVGQPTEVVQTSSATSINAVTGTTNSTTSLTRKVRYYYTTSPNSAFSSWSSTASGYLRRTDVLVADPSFFQGVGVCFYDAFGRMIVDQDAFGKVMRYEYDALDRITKVIYPDDSAELVSYLQDGEMQLHPTVLTGRDGKITRHYYNNLAQRIVTTDANQLVTLYEWCRCGDLKRLVNPDGKAVTWRHDIQGRVTGKIREDGSQASYEFYPYSGRPWKATLPADQGSGHHTYLMGYDPQGQVRRLNYHDSSMADVTVTEQDWMNRPTSFTDGIGTTTVTYEAFGVPGGGQVKVFNGPLVHDAIRMQFAHFGDIMAYENVSEPVSGGSIVRQFERTAYDKRGRPLSIYTNSGSQELQYGGDDVPSGIQHKLGATAAIYSEIQRYMPAGPGAANDKLGMLASITHYALSSWDVVAQHNYDYELSGAMNSWRYQSAAYGSGGTAQPAIDREWFLKHDAINQLNEVVSKVGGTPVQQWNYQYDGAGNKRSEINSGQQTLTTTDGMNRLIERGGGGLTPISGLIDQAAEVTVNGERALLSAVGSGPQHRFDMWLNLPAGNNTLTVSAMDAASRTTTQNYSVDISADALSYEYDANGNLRFERHAVTLAVQREFQWDIMNKLRKIVLADGTSTEFIYDGKGQRRIVRDRDASGVLTKESQLLWHNGRVWQERDSAGLMVRQEHGNGATVYSPSSNTGAGGISHVRLVDHLGSSREIVLLIGGVPQIVGRRDYDPYGQIIETGVNPSPVAYTGHEVQLSSGLHFSLYRAYDQRLGRWLSEDPLGEDGGLNLHGYVGGSPVMATDPLGLYVNIVYNSSSGTLTATDTDSGKTMTSTGCKSGSGLGLNNPKFENKVNRGPIPRNTYLVSPSSRFPGWYSLLGRQRFPYDYYDKGAMVQDNSRARYGYSFTPPNSETQRSGLHLHPQGEYSAGCVGVPKEDYSKLQSMFNDVKTPYMHNGEAFPGFMTVQ